MKTYKWVVHNPKLNKDSKGTIRARYSDHVLAEGWQSATDLIFARIARLNTVHAGWSIKSLEWIHD